MSLTIAEALQQAQQAINGGDFGSATTTCSQLVSQYPGYAAAHQLLGEAYREMGQVNDAERAYVAALTRNPRQPETCLGLGLIAEDQGSNEAALAFCQVAWELAPNRSVLREPLTRVSLRRYGSDGELQLTHAALAQLHASAARLHRAVTEFRLALAQLPTRIDLKIGLLEALWRLGDDTAALKLAREIVELQPQCAPALVILTDLERRCGNTRRADDLLKQLRAVDPDGALVSEMLPLNARADQQYLSLTPAAMPFLDEDIVAVPERPKIAPAPDFDYHPTRSEVPTPDIHELAPMSFEEFGAADDGTPHTPIDVAAFSLDDLGDLPEGLEPISIDELGGLPGDDASIAPFDASFDYATGTRDTAPEAEAPAPFTLEEVLRFESPIAGPVPVAEAALDDQLLFAEAAGAPAPEQTDIVVEDLASLAASLEGEVAGALSRAGEPVANIAEGQPPAVAPRGYTTVLRGLEDQGLAPFDPRSREPIEGMPSMLEDDVLALEEVAPRANQELVTTTDSAAVTDDFGKITRDWDTIDDEIRAALPTMPGRGYTDELRSLDEIGLMPFEVEEDDDPLAGVAPFNPFSSDPIAPPAPEPLSEPDAPSTTTDQLVASTSEPDADAAANGLLGELQPFAFEEFDHGHASAEGQSRSFFNQGGWEASASAVPSDADLDALLAFEDEEPSQGLEPDSIGQVDVVHEASAAATKPVTTPFELTPTGQEPSSDIDALLAPPSLSETDLNEFFENSFAVTRQLPGDEPYPAHHFEPSGPETTFGGSPQTTTAESDAVRPEPTDPETAPSIQTLTASLRPDTEVFTRARAVKLGLISEGRIGGTLEIGEGITTDELIALEDRLRTRNLPEIDLDPIDDDDDDLIAATGATRDTRTLRAALEVTPDDDELRWWLAEALRDRGDLDDAYSEYRWLIRHAPHRHEQIVDALNESVDREQSPETAHRLLGDIYRRRGDVTRASSHATLALQMRRRTGRIA